jgi:putative hydrolase of the HAD superfamily
MIRYDAILFDVGGTLLYGEPTDAALLARRFQAAGHHDAEAAINAAFHDAQYKHLRSTARTKDAAGNRESARTYPDFLTIVAEEIRSLLHCECSRTLIADTFETGKDDRRWKLLDPELPALLSALRQKGYPVGIVSNWESGLQEVLEGAGIARYFDEIVSSYDLGIEKPNPGIFLHACSQMQVASERTLYVGDMALDVVGAQSAGMEVALVGTTALATLAGLEIRPTFGLAKVSEVLGLL